MAELSSLSFFGRLLSRRLSWRLSMAGETEDCLPRMPAIVVSTRRVRAPDDRPIGRQYNHADLVAQLGSAAQDGGKRRLAKIAATRSSVVNDRLTEFDNVA
jgi:hypothetical protein